MLAHFSCIGMSSDTQTNSILGSKAKEIVHNASEHFLMNPQGGSYLERTLTWYCYR